MKDGDRDGARALLVEVVRRFPDDPLADAALYELARLARAGGDDAGAAAFLDELLARDRDPALREPARYLRCRIEVDAARADAAAACLAAFRRDFPRSPHDAEVLALLVGYAHARGDCAAAAPLAREYLRRHPGGPFADGARDRLARCER
jgi:hypothetical protein